MKKPSDRKTDNKNKIKWHKKLHQNIIKKKKYKQTIIISKKLTIVQAITVVQMYFPEHKYKVALSSLDIPRNKYQWQI